MAANVATPKDFLWDADKTLDVSTVSAEEINQQVYTMDTKDAVYTITGKNSNHTALRFVISEGCTVILIQHLQPVFPIMMENLTMANGNSTIIFVSSIATFFQHVKSYFI